MGLLKTRWEASHGTHVLAVVRDELTKGFAIEWDGDVIARRTWSWIGLGQLDGTADVDGTAKEVHVALQWGGEGFEGKCTITIDGEDVPATRVT